MPTKPQFLVLQANGFIDPSQPYNARMVPKFTAKWPLDKRVSTKTPFVFKRQPSTRGSQISVGPLSADRPPQRPTQQPLYHGGMSSSWQAYHGGNGYGGNAYGSNGYGGNPYGGNPYGGNPYGGNAYGGNAYGDMAYQHNGMGMHGYGMAYQNDGMGMHNNMMHRQFTPQHNNMQSVHDRVMGWDGGQQSNMPPPPPSPSPSLRNGGVPPTPQMQTASVFPSPSPYFGRGSAVDNIVNQPGQPATPAAPSHPKPAPASNAASAQPRRQWLPPAEYNKLKKQLQKQRKNGNCNGKNGNGNEQRLHTITHGRVGKSKSQGQAHAARNEPEATDEDDDQSVEQSVRSRPIPLADRFQPRDADEPVLDEDAITRFFVRKK